MQQEHKARWSNCLKLIAANVSPQIYKTWFEPIVFESYDEQTTTLLLQVPSPYVYEYLEQHYVQLMGWALSKSFNANVCLTYRVVTDKEHKVVMDVESEPRADIEAPQPRTRANQSPTALDAAIPQDLNPQLDPRKTFESYIEGDANKLPRTVGLSIAEHPGKSTFNPFFIYGPSGCGKTHLINAIGVQTKKLYPQKRVLYVSAHLFMVQYVNAKLQNVINDFINFYQTIDVLIVDDVQEWATAEKTVEAFFHIFDHLFRLGKQIILASDRPPVDLGWLTDRMLTRFSCGLIAELDRPNLKLRIDILNSKCRRDGLRIAPEVIEFIADNATGSVRDLEGVLNSLMAFSIVYNSNVDMRLAERIIKRAVKTDNNPLTIEEILEKVCRHYNVTQQQVFGKSRRRDYVQARQLSMYLAQKYIKLPAARIGQIFGGRDHSTVLHSCSAIEKRLKTDRAFSDELASIETSFRLKA